MSVVPTQCVKCSGSLLHRPVLVVKGEYDNLGEWCPVCKISFYNHANGWRCGHPTCSRQTSCYSELDANFDCLHEAHHLPNCPDFTKCGIIRGVTCDHLQISFRAKCPKCQSHLHVSTTLVKHARITDQNPEPSNCEYLGISFQLWCSECLMGYTHENKWSCSHPVPTDTDRLKMCSEPLANFQCATHSGCCKPEINGDEVNYVQHFRKKRARIYTFDFTTRKIKASI